MHAVNRLVYFEHPLLEHGSILIFFILPPTFNVPSCLDLELEFFKSLKIKDILLVVRVFRQYVLPQGAKCGVTYLWTVTIRTFCWLGAACRILQLSVFTLATCDGNCGGKMNWVRAILNF